MSTLASTAMPMVRMMPAMPGRVKVNPNIAIAPKRIRMLMVRPIKAMMPAEAVVDQHEDEGEREADDAGVDPLLDDGLAEAGGDGALLVDLERVLERVDEGGGEVARPPRSCRGPR